MKVALSPVVKDALDSGKPVVALESTVIAHGLPYPDNIETALAMEAAVIENGAVPATIAVIKGVPTAGLDSDAISHFAQSKNIEKLSIRDLPIAAARMSDGATTVASTMKIAEMAGIRVFATGGIGGVHKDGNWDVSADLPVLASIPVVTVCSGAKAILDLPATVEWLETHGVPVLGWQTKDFPAFYSISSGLETVCAVETAVDVTDIVKARDSFGMKQAVLVCVPIPEESELDSAAIARMTAEAVNKSNELGITGKELSPFLLSELSNQSGGETLAANIALLINNAGVAARIAVAFV